MNITVLSPAGYEPGSEPSLDVARLTELSGINLGLLDNSKQNADALLLAVAKELEPRFRLNSRLWQKGEGTGAAGPVPEVVAEQIVAEMDAALVALGD